MNPRDIKKMMKQMDMQEIEADAVIIITADKELVFTHPKVTKMSMMGQESYQVVGSPEERALEGGGEEDGDLEMIVEKTGVNVDEARQALADAEGDIAQAIINLND